MDNTPIGSDGAIKSTLPPFLHFYCHAADARHDGHGGDQGESQRVIDYLFSPLAKIAPEALREIGRNRFIAPLGEADGRKRNKAIALSGLGEADGAIKRLRPTRPFR
jgi:hypothetical protein